MGNSSRGCGFLLNPFSPFSSLCVSPDDTVGDLKKLIAAQTGTKWDKIVLKKWCVMNGFA